MIEYYSIIIYFFLETGAGPDNGDSLIFFAFGGGVNSNRLPGRLGFICQSLNTASYCGFISFDV